MRYPLLLSLFALASPALTQNYYIPDNDPTTGIPNSIPFGSTTTSFTNCRMHVRATAAELGAVANLITGLGFACGSTGAAHYDTLDIVMDHIPSSQALSTTFANNLTVNAIPVLSVADYTWNVTADVWNEVGLQTFFPYNGIDDLVIEITTTGGSAPGGMRRATNQRIYSTTLGATSGVSSSSANKFEVSMLTARTSSYGNGCPGSNGTPLHGFSGSAQVGNGLFFEVANGLQNGLALVLVGSTNAAPFPLDLTSLNMPGCFAYTDLGFVDVVLLDGSGSGSYPFAVPAGALGFLLYSQFACLDPTANAFGFTTSNYGRVLTGN